MSSLAIAVRRIPNNVEVVVVIVVAFWWIIYESTRWFALGQMEYGWWIWESTTVEGSRIGPNGEAVALIEVFFFVLLFAFLRARGWTLRDLNLLGNVRSVWHAIIFFIMLLVIHVIIFKAITLMGLLYPKIQFELRTAFDRIYPDFTGEPQRWEMINFYSWLPSIVIDAFYYEFFLLCYLFKRLEKSSFFIVVGLTTAVRLLCYLHLGPYEWISILVISFSMGWYYWRFKNLIVPIVVHVLWNFIVFYFYPPHA
jgi:membrane protease YdiL (CAAX protease family)